MEEKISKSKYLLATAILSLAVIFNLLYWHNWILGSIVGLAYFGFFSFIFGSIFIPKQAWQIIFGLVFLLCFIAIFGAAFIYFYQFNNYIFILLILLIPALLPIPYYQTEVKEKLSLKKILGQYLEKFSQRKEPKINIALVIAYLILAGGCFFLLIHGQTTESIQAPWQVVNTLFFPLYFFATAFLLIYLFNSNRTKLPLALLIIHTLLSSSVALIVYRVGYGFDPFIHQATEKIIAQTGTITPKPLYYLGQYAITVFLSKLTFIDLPLIDRALVPILFSLLIAPITFYAFSHWISKKYALVLALAILVIPYSSFIMTAPQNLANLLFIITILLSLLYFKNALSVLVLYLLAFATLAIHPLAGIPLLITVFLFNLFKLLYTSYIKYVSLYFLAGLVFVIALPLAFVINGSQILLTLPALNWTDFDWLGFVDKFDLPLNLVYLIYFNEIILALIIIIIGIVYIAKNKLLKNNAGYLMAAFIIFLNFVITKYFLTFPDLRQDDKNAFIKRLAILAFYVLLPFFLLGLYWLIKLFWPHSAHKTKQNLYAKAFLIFILAGAITISLYLSYPRFNQYQPEKFFSLSASDIKTVDFIEQIAGADHIVLANQMVGAAAISEFGFKKYYDNQFYYSMPMGTPQTFYNHYLEMVYQGAKKNFMDQAMTEAGVSESYFVLNQYWNNSQQITQLATASADSVYNIDNGKVYIFKYTK